MRLLLPLVAVVIIAASSCHAQESRTKMRSLSDMPERHVTIARSDTDYISFPDVCLTQGGRLICVYRVADKHVAKRSRLEIKTSEDLGKTWSEPTVLNADRGHCARLSVMEDGEVILIGDATGVYRSRDEGRTWSDLVKTGFRHGIPDRPLRVGEKSLLTAAHRHVGRGKNPILGQNMTQQVMYRSDDMGKTWFEWAPLAVDTGLVLCEVSMFKMPDGSLRAYLRENAGVQEPTYVMESSDEGKTWSYPEASPSMGHRPCAGLLNSGKVLVTYRHVGPNGGNRAWLGDPDKERFFAPSAFDLGNGATLADDALIIENDSGTDNAVTYCLRPITDPRYATARLDAALTVERNEGNHCGIRFGCHWRIFPDRVEPQATGIEPIPVDATQPHRYSFIYDKGVVALSIDGEEKMRFTLSEHGMGMDRRRRAIRFGNVPDGDPLLNPFKFSKNAGRSIYKSVSLTIDEPRYGHYEWSWSPGDGLPNQYEVDRILELHNDRHSSRGDFGYSGWIQLPDGRAFCVVHYKGDAPYSYVEGVWIEESDFGAGD